MVLTGCLLTWGAAALAQQRPTLKKTSAGSIQVYITFVTAKQDFVCWAFKEKRLRARTVYALFFQYGLAPEA